MQTHTRTYTHRHTLSSAVDILVILMRTIRLKSCIVLGVTVHVRLHYEDERLRKGTQREEVENVS